MSTNAALLLAVALFCLLFRRRRTFHSLPPGPSGLPLLGSALQLPRKLMHLKFIDWKEIYGDIFTFSAGSQRIVVLSKAETTADILDRMSAPTSARPHFPMADLMTRRMTFGLASADQRWRRSRRIAHESFNIRAVGAFRPMLEENANELISELRRNPTQLREALHLFSGQTAWRALYGDSPVDILAAIEGNATRTGAIAQRITPTGSLINVLPILQKLPDKLSPWASFGNKFYGETTDKLISMIRLGFRQEETSFVSSCFRARNKFEEVTEADIAWTAEALFSGAFGTSRYSLYFFCLAMVVFPDVAKKGREAIDKVVGAQPPSFDHYARLPYVQAMVKEVLRWRPVLPTGMPHLATEDIVYNDKLIPKGTYIFPNIWSMSHDPDVFPEPAEFRPERYLDATGQIKPAAKNYHYEDLVTFGYGRRICPGRHLAMDELFIAIANLLWAFEFDMAIDASGMKMVPTLDVLADDNTFIYPAPFEYVLRPRHSRPAEGNANGVAT